MTPENNTPLNPFPHAMRYGLVLGFSIIILFILLTISQTWASVLALLTIPGIMVLVYRIAVHYRDTECGGVIRYYQVFSYILILFFFGSLVAGALRFCYLEFINPTYLTETFNQAMVIFEQMQMDLTPELVAEMERAMTPIRFTWQFIMFDCMQGLFLALLYAFFIRKK